MINHEESWYDCFINGVLCKYRALIDLEAVDEGRKCSINLFFIGGKLVWRTLFSFHFCFSFPWIIFQFLCGTANKRANEA